MVFCAPFGIISVISGRQLAYSLISWVAPVQGAVPLKCLAERQAEWNNADARMHVDVVNGSTDS